MTRRPDPNTMTREEMHAEIRANLAEANDNLKWAVVFQTAALVLWVIALALVIVKASGVLGG